MTGLEFAQALKRGPIVFPGGYTLRLILTDGEVMCFECAKENAARIRCAAMNHNRFHNGWAPLGFDVLWEGPDEQCCNCNKDLPTEYGDPP